MNDPVVVALMAFVHCQACVRGLQKAYSLPFPIKPRTILLKERGHKQPLFHAMATLVEWLRTMPPNQTNQCGRSRNYGNESTIKKLVLFVVSRSVVAATIQKPAGFPSERYRRDRKEYCSILRSVALPCSWAQCDQWLVFLPICHNRRKHNVQTVPSSGSLQRCSCDNGVWHRQGVIQRAIGAVH
jgi:hypothetical protein